MANSKHTVYSDYSDSPQFLKEFLYYMQTIRGLSVRSVESYYIDLKLFLRYMWQKRNNCINNDSISDVSISNLDIDFLSNISQSDILDFLFFVMNERGNSAAARARKLSSLRGFYKYMTKKTNQLDYNPTENIELPQNKKRLPKYLTFEQCVNLLANIETSFTSRDFCIIMLFMNCGMRLSEQAGIDLKDIRDDTLRIIGKGNKERTVYLNVACLSALEEYITERNTIVSPAIEPALFISKTRKGRLSTRSIQLVVERCLKLAGLDGQGYSPHKLRHTAATLLYRSGGADMLALKEILGHEHVSTTEIYTHISDEELKKAAKASPLSSFKKPKKKKDTSDTSPAAENEE
ncbi:MAG: tyrosine recombinase XerC [Oscillospiraceae bacterium]|nr:tyrosine recombinase XerC [Oscillospiraceae bacterium]